MCANRRNRHKHNRRHRVNPLTVNKGAPSLCDYPPRQRPCDTDYRPPRRYHTCTNSVGLFDRRTLLPKVRRHVCNRNRLRHRNGYYDKRLCPCRIRYRRIRDRNRRRVKAVVLFHNSRKRRPCPTERYDNRRCSLVPSDFDWRRRTHNRRRKNDVASATVGLLRQ